MAHCIQVIIAPTSTANAISDRWPELPRLKRKDGFVVLPVSADLVDARIAPDKTPFETGAEFMLLTNGFRTLLQTLSRGGMLAYIETEYFGGVGGQGAVVCRDGAEIMPPTWSESGVINDALSLLELAPRDFRDRFIAAGFGDVRHNDDFLDLIKRQKAAKNA